jgi:hypothetical protein
VRVAPLALILVASILVGCGDDGGTTFSADVSDGEVAAGACGLLVSWTNDVAETDNDVQDEMVEGADVQGLMQSTLEDLIERTEDLQADLEDLDYPDSAGGHDFADELSAGAAAAQEDLAGFLAEVEAIPDPDPEALRYRREQMVIELEKPRSLVKPDVQGDLGDDDLEAAIADEESCGFVTRSQ